MSETLKVAVSTIGRFHSFDLAAELQRHGHLAAIFTGYPRRNFRNVPVDPRHIRPFPWVQTPIALAQRFGLMPAFAYRDLAWWAHQTLDRHVARHLPACHAISVLSGSGLATGRAAQARNIAYVCDRGSSHIAWQDRTLREEYAAFGLAFAGVDPRFIDKEMAEYAQADAITVPSGFVHDSFVEMGVAPAKLHRIPYGVDLAQFRPSAPRDPAFRVLFVGRLSVRKGLAYLLQGFARAALGDARLVLVGAAPPEAEALLARFPVAALERTGPLPRAEVAVEMSRASVLVLPSVEEGLALVLAQALACGCPVIASRNTGAEDLITDGEQGFVVPVRDADAIAARLVRLYEDRELRARMSAAALARVREIGGWRDYGAASIRLFHALATARGHDLAPLE